MNLYIFLAILLESPEVIFFLIVLSNFEVHVYVITIFLHQGWLILFNICTTETIESEDDIREFVKAKIESLVANVVADQDMVAETETNRFKSATTRFHRIFNIPVDEKLVNCKLCVLYIQAFKLPFGQAKTLIY